MKTICIFVLYLQAVVRQMNVLVVRVITGVNFAWGSNIPLVVNIEVLTAVCERPKSNVKLPTFVKQRFLKVLLNHPIGKLYTRFKKSDNLVEIVEDFDSFTLVFISRLYQPHILVTMLLRYPLFDGLTVPFLQVLISPNELVILVCFKIWTQYECGWRCFKNLIIGLHKIDVVFIIIFERSNQTSFGGEISVAFQMVDHQLVKWVLHLIALVMSIVDWAIHLLPNQ